MTVDSRPATFIEITGEKKHVPPFIAVKYGQGSMISHVGWININVNTDSHSGGHTRVP